MSTPRANTVRSIIFGTNIHLEKQGATLQDSDPWLATKQYEQITVWEEVLQRGTSVLKKKGLWRDETNINSCQSDGKIKVWRGEGCAQHP